MFLSVDGRRAGGGRCWLLAVGCWLLTTPAPGLATASSQPPAASSEPPAASSEPIDDCQSVSPSNPTLKLMRALRGTAGWM